MKIKETTLNGVAIAAVTGRIDSGTAGACEVELLKAVQGGHRAVVLDLAGVDYLSSAGIRALVMVFKRAAASKLPISLARPQDHVQEILEIAGLDDILIAYPSIEAAVDAIG